MQKTQRASHCRAGSHNFFSNISKNLPSPKLWKAGLNQEDCISRERLAKRAKPNRPHGSRSGSSYTTSFTSYQNTMARTLLIKENNPPRWFRRELWCLSPYAKQEWTPQVARESLGSIIALSLCAASGPASFPNIESNTSSCRAASDGIRQLGKYGSTKRPRHSSLALAKEGMLWTTWIISHLKYVLRYSSISFWLNHITLQTHPSTIDLSSQTLFCILCLYCGSSLLMIYLEMIQLPCLVHLCYIMGDPLQLSILESAWVLQPHKLSACNSAHFAKCLQSVHSVEHKTDLVARTTC